MKRLFLISILSGFAATALAGTSYDAITGQSFSNFYNPGSVGILFADDTTLANLDPVNSVDVDLYNPTNSTATSYRVTLSIFDTDPSTGLPNNLLTSETESIVVGVGAAFTANFAFGFPWTPPTADLYTGLTINGGNSLGWIIPGNDPTVGSSQDEFAQLDSGIWGLFYFGGEPVANFAARYNTAAVTPEPASMAALGIGALGLLLRRRKR